MLPTNVRQFLSKLREKTESGEFKWNYDDMQSTVYVQASEFQVTIRYRFNENEEFGEFSIFYYELPNGSEFRFYTNEQYKDYDLVRSLFDVAQASSAKFPF